jgi:hypothetical protein
MHLRRMFQAALLTLAIAAPTSGSGVIEGALLFPACDVPKDLEVCVEDAKGKLTCTSKLRVLEATLAYTIEVPAGEYKVFARTESTLPGVRAYYTEAVRCGMDVSCEDHTPIFVSVKAGSHLEKIHPADWEEPQSSVLSYNN